MPNNESCIMRGNMAFNSNVDIISNESVRQTVRYFVQREYLDPSGVFSTKGIFISC